MNTGFKQSNVGIPIVSMTKCGLYRFHVRSAKGKDSPAIVTEIVKFFSAQDCAVFLVGGYLRDSLLRRAGGDLDVAVSGDPQVLARRLAKALGGSYVPLSPQWGVARVVLPAPPSATGDPPGLLDHSGMGTGMDDGINDALTIDIAGFSATIEDDLARRDFTVDALALPLADWTSGQWRERVVDPYNGIQDLAEKRVRAVSSSIFRDDPGRLLRAVRLAAQLGFRLEPDTARLIRSEAFQINRVSGERVRDELLAILAGDGSRGQLETLDRLDLLCRVIPELALTKGVDQPLVHYWDVWGHLLHSVETAELVTKGHQNSAIYTLAPWTPALGEHFGEKVCDGHTRRTILKLTALLHDIAKPQTKAIDETGRTRFLGHSELGAEMAASRLTELRLSARGIAMVSKMVEQHLRPGNMRQGADWPTSRAIYRYFRDLGDVAIDTLFLALADYLAAKGPELMLDQWGEHARIIAHILESGTHQTASEKIPRLVTGHDLMQELGLEPGPRVGILLEKINEAWAAGEVNTREEALALAAKANNQE